MSVGMVAASESNDTFLADSDVDDVVLADGEAVSEKTVTTFDEIEIDSDYNVTAKLKSIDKDPVADADVSYSCADVSGNVKTDANGLFKLQTVPDSTLVLNFAGNDKFAPATSSIYIDEFKPIVLKSMFNLKEGYRFTTYAIDYNAGERGKNLKFTLTDSDGEPIANASVNILINGVSNFRTTDENGVGIIQINLAKAMTYNFQMIFDGDDGHNGTIIGGTIKVNKKPITISAAAKKTYGVKTKTKKYVVTLKTSKCSSSNGKAYLKSGKKVYLKVGGKTYTAKINSKGKATFKITKLNKKGKYTALIKFNGDSAYKAKTKKVKLTIK